MHNRVRASSAGFTLLEILVALVLIGLLVGTLLPSVLNQLTRGEINRISEDLNAISNAAKTFRVDVQRWPGDLEDLVTAPASTADSTLNPGGTTYPSGLAGKWAGPYVEQGTIKGDSLPTAAGGVIVNRFSRTTWGGRDFLTIKAKGITVADAQALSLRIDGDTVTNITATDAAGQIRFRVGTGGAVDTLYYLAAPVQ